MGIGYTKEQAEELIVKSVGIFQGSKKRVVAGRRKRWEAGVAFVSSKCGTLWGISGGWL